MPKATTSTKKAKTPTKKSPVTKKKATPKKTTASKARKTATTKKKAPAKKSNQKKATSKQPVVAQGSLCFWVADGNVLAHMKDLEQALTNMDEGVFAFHAEGDSNDFVNWVDQVLCDGDCAKALAGAKNKGEAGEIVAEYTSYYVFE